LDIRRFIAIIVVSVVLFGISEAFAQSIVNVGNQGEQDYFLRVIADPNIIFISGNGFYSEGTLITLDHAPDKWRDYVFVGWQIDGRWAGDTPTIRMNKDHTATAVYTKSGDVYVKIDAIPRIMEITVDDKIYFPSELPLSFNWKLNSKHIITASDTLNETPNTRYIFDMWKDRVNDITREIEAIEDVEFVALYKKQHYLKPITEYGQTEGAGWWDEGSTVNFKIQSDIVEDPGNGDIRHVFESWDIGDYKNLGSNRIDLQQAVVAKANWKEQYKLEILTNIPDYAIFGGGWYDLGKNIALIADEELESPRADIKYVFDRWVSKGPNPVIVPSSSSASTTITMEEPYILEAQYKKSYLLNVWTPFGIADGGGFYDAGEVAEIRMKSTEVIVDPNKIRKVLNGWNAPGASLMDFSSESVQDIPIRGADQNLLIFVDRPLNITSNWKTQYYLDVKSLENPASGSGWYGVGRIAPISVKVPSTPPGMWSVTQFEKWTGDIESNQINSRVIMNEPKTVVAEWKESYGPGLVNSIILFGAAGGGLAIYTKTKHKMSKSNGKKASKESVSVNKFFNLSNSKNNNLQDMMSGDSKIKQITKSLSSILKRLALRRKNRLNSGQQTLDNGFDSITEDRSKPESSDDIFKFMRRDD